MRQAYRDRAGGRGPGVSEVQRRDLADYDRFFDVAGDERAEVA
jgi:hypothetical protein